MTIADLQDVCWWLDRLVTWTRDQDVWKMPEHWEHHVPEFKSRHPIKCDCDGYALTGLELAKERGMKCRAALVNDGKLGQEDRAYNHMVGLVEINGNWWVIDCNRPLQKSAASAYHWYAWSDNLSSPSWNLYAEGAAFEKTGEWK